MTNVYNGWDWNWINNEMKAAMNNDKKWGWK
jgi:hypothetical protein